MQFNQHIDKTLLHPIIEASTHQVIELNNLPSESQSIDSEITPTLDPPNLAIICPEVSPRKSPMKKFRLIEDRTAETNPFKAAIAQYQDSELTESMSLGNKSVRMSRNPFEKLTKRSGKVLDDADDFEEYGSQDELEKSFVSSISSSPNLNQGPAKQQMNIGAWTAGVMGGGSSKLQAIQKWFKSESLDARDCPKKRGDLSELASVSVRDLVKAIGAAGSGECKGNGNSPQQLSQSSSPISIPFSKSQRLQFLNLLLLLIKYY